ncbi:hypothetical protein ABT115_09290 [Streptomyces sp. NPDC001832]
MSVERAASPTRLELFPKLLAARDALHPESLRAAVKYVEAEADS